jgi:hypothetical protein
VINKNSLARLRMRRWKRQRTADRQNAAAGSPARLTIDVRERLLELAAEYEAKAKAAADTTKSGASD